MRDKSSQAAARTPGTLTEAQNRRLEKASGKAIHAQIDYRSAVLRVMAEGGSFAAVSAKTGLSTATLQKWKRDAAESLERRD